MKYLLVILVVGVVLWLMFGMKRRVDKPPPQPGNRSAGQLPKMVACAHCGVHLPDKDAPHDAEGRPYCSDAHRVAGQR
jgi:uncharacterized protein